MSLKAVIATLVLGSSSVALASPQIRDHRSPAPVQARIDAHFDARLMPGRRPVFVSQPVLLVDDAKLAGRIRVNSIGNQRFTKLELTADRGKTAIRDIVVYFANGASRTIKLDTKVSQKEPTLTVDLPGYARNIDHIVINGSAMTGNAALDVRAL